MTSSCYEVVVVVALAAPLAAAQNVTEADDPRRSDVQVAVLAYIVQGGMA